MPRRSILSATDPHFVEKTRDIVGLYIDPPIKAMVLCVDEKNQIQATRQNPAHAAAGSRHRGAAHA